MKTQKRRQRDADKRDINLTILLGLLALVVDEPSPVDGPDPSADWWDVEEPPTKNDHKPVADSNDESALLELSSLVDA